MQCQCPPLPLISLPLLSSLTLLFSNSSLRRRRGVGRWPQEVEAGATAGGGATPPKPAGRRHKRAERRRARSRWGSGGRSRAMRPKLAGAGGRSGDTHCRWGGGGGDPPEAGGVATGGGATALAGGAATRAKPAWRSDGARSRGGGLGWRRAEQRHLKPKGGACWQRTGGSNPPSVLIPSRGARPPPSNPSPSSSSSSAPAAMGKQVGSGSLPAAADGEKAVEVGGRRRVWQRGGQGL